MALTTKFERRLERLEGMVKAMRRKAIIRMFTASEYRAWLETTDGRDYRSEVGAPLGGMIITIGDPVEKPCHTTICLSSDIRTPTLPSG